MPQKTVTQTATDVDIYTNAGRQITEIRDLIIENGSANAATVTVKDKYTYSDGTPGEKVLYVLSIAAGQRVQLTQLKGARVIGGLYVNTDQQPLNVSVDVESI